MKVQIYGLRHEWLGAQRTKWDTMLEYILEDYNGMRSRGIQCAIVLPMIGQEWPDVEFCPNCGHFLALSHCICPRVI